MELKILLRRDWSKYHSMWYFQIEKLVNFDDNNSQSYCFYLMFDQINAANAVKNISKNLGTMVDVQKTNKHNIKRNS